MPKDKVYEKLLQHDKEFVAINKQIEIVNKKLEKDGETLSRQEIKLLRIEMVIRGQNNKFEEHDKRIEEVSDKIDNFKVAVMNALDHLVVSADRVDKERLVTTYRIDDLDERVNQHDKEIHQLKTAR